jgi:hypothetical protein
MQILSALNLLDRNSKFCAIAIFVTDELLMYTTFYL